MRVIRFVDGRAIGNAHPQAIDNANEAARYFGESLDAAAIVIRIGVFPFRATLCLHGNIFVARGIVVPSVHLLVHEFGHVWEWQHGQWQISLGAFEQTQNLFRDVYDYGGAIGVRAAVKAGRTLESFNREQQAEIFADDWQCKARGRDDPYARDLAALTAPALAARPPRSAPRRRPRAS